MHDKNTFFPSGKKFKVLWNLHKTPLDFVKSSLLTEFHKHSVCTVFPSEKGQIWSKNRQLKPSDLLRRNFYIFFINIINEEKALAQINQDYCTTDMTDSCYPALSERKTDLHAAEAVVSTTLIQDDDTGSQLTSCTKNPNGNTRHLSAHWPFHH